MIIRKIDAQEPVAAKKLRVAAYCRVSTENADQKESLEAQKAHYETWIKRHSDWEFAGVFYDFGISGTKADSRDGLQALLYACRTGSIDYVLTKSISRFSRNTADCLSLVRELLSCNISIYFEKENIDTGSMDSELILSMLSSMAQDESESISKNVKWSIQQRIEAGTFKFGYPPYGYTKDANGNYVIEPTEAEVIRLIFSSALNGMGTYKIAQMLEKKKIPTRKGGKWSGSTIKGILVNEKYYGAAAFMKTYTDSSFRRHNNHGEVDSYYAEEHHEPIISREMFDKVQLVLQKHAEEHNIEADVGKYQNKYPFSGKIICGECGGKFKRQTQTTGIAWACTTHLYGGSVGAMKAMGGDSLNLSDAELKKIVDDWRDASPNIVKLWWAVDDAVKKAIKQKTTTETHGLQFSYQSKMLFITLPSGRKLCYAHPQIGENQFGGESVTYMGVGASKKWERIESYGPKFVENIVQAVARDLLMYSVQTLSHCFIVGHIHDEMIIEADRRMSLDEVCRQMERTPAWAEGLLLRADGYECEFYRKD